MSTPTHAPPSQYSLYSWNAQRLIEATATLNGHWLDETQAMLSTINSPYISTDTRNIKSGDIFLALSGDNFDGHDYAHVAVAQGAKAIIVEKIISKLDIPQLIVSDARLALGQLGKYRRHQHNHVKIIAITGSSGKTTVKEMLGSIFSRIAPTLVTRGNLNNDLGVPMMLLELADEHQFAILELGANHLGEIAYSAELVEPDVACILNIGTAHLGEFGSRKNIAQAKAEIYQGLDRQTGVAIFPECDDFSQELQIQANQCSRQSLGFGKTHVTASDIQLNDFSSEFIAHTTIEGKQTSHNIHVPLAGEHNVMNALAVIGCAQAVKIDMVDIIEGLQSVQPPKGRLYRQQFGEHYLIDDSYNANPHSVRASAQVLASQNGQKIMVLGDIGELGDSARQAHYQLGSDIANMAIDKIYTLGDWASIVVDGATAHSSPISAQAFSDKQALLTALQNDIKHYHDEPCHILFKGSRFMKMETLFDALATDYLAH